MDFASALQKLEQTANAAQQGNNNANNNYSSNQQPQPSSRNYGGRGGRSGSGGGGGGGDYRGGGRGRGGYYNNNNNNNNNNNSSYYNNSNNPRRRGRSDYLHNHNNSNNNNNNDTTDYNNNRRNTRPRLGSGDGGGSGSYYPNNKPGGGRGSSEYYPRGGGSGGGSRSTSPPTNSHHHHHHHHHRPPPPPPPPRPLDEMQRFGFRIDPFQPPAELPADLGQRPFHICLLAIVIDSLPYEHIWRHWATTASSSSSFNKCRVSLLVHAKYPNQVQSEFLRQHLLTKPPRIGRGNSYADPEYWTHVPAWGSVQITRAMIDLLRAGYTLASPDDALFQETDPRFTSRRFLLNSSNSSSSSSNSSSTEDDGTKDSLVDGSKIPMADKFLFISETCLPVQTLEEYVRAFFGDAQLYNNNNKGGAGKGSSDALADPKEAAAETTTKDKSSSIKPPDATAEATTTTTTITITRDDASSRRHGGGPHGRAITPWEVSWVNARSRTTPGTPRNKYESDQFADIHRMVHGHYRWKADQWLCLSRWHAGAILNIDSHIPPYHQLWNSFKKVSASDEMYFPCCLAVLQILESSQAQQQQQQQSSQPALGINSNHDPSKDDNNNPDELLHPQHQVALRAVTYTDWSEGMRNPATFTNGAVDLERVAKVARRQGSVVARKFALRRPVDNDPVTGAITVEEWTRVMETCQAYEEKERQERQQLQRAKEEQERQAAAAAAENAAAEKESLEQLANEEEHEKEHEKPASAEAEDKESAAEDKESQEQAEEEEEDQDHHQQQQQSKEEETATALTTEAALNDDVGEDDDEEEEDPF